jgi:hypothetical protein
MTWNASIVTADLATRVDVTAHLTEFAGVVRHLAAGEWRATLPASVWPRLAAAWPAQDEAPLLFVLRWSDASKGVVMSGPILEASLERNGGVETVGLSGVDEYAALFGSRIVYPQPADPPPWTTSDYHVITAQASAAVAELVTQHAGSGARTERQTPGLVVIDQGVGSTQTWRYRLASLADAVKEIAEAENLRVDVQRNTDATVTVTVGATAQHPQYVLDETKLADFTVTLSTGAATTVVAGGSGDGTARLFALAGGGVAGAARRESFTDQRSIGSQPTLQASADANRSTGSASTSLAGQLLPTVAVRWRQQYQLGDTITLQAQGVRYQAQVTAVTVEIGDEGLVFSPVLGKASRYALTQLLRDVAGLGARLSSLEVS